jgi:hypothetical protein
MSEMARTPALRCAVGDIALFWSVRAAHAAQFFD